MGWEGVREATRAFPSVRFTLKTHLSLMPDRPSTEFASAAEASPEDGEAAAETNGVSSEPALPPTEGWPTTVKRLWGLGAPFLGPYLTGDGPAEAARHVYFHVGRPGGSGWNPAPPSSEAPPPRAGSPPRA